MEDGLNILQLEDKLRDNAFTYLTEGLDELFQVFCFVL